MAEEKTEEKKLHAKNASLWGQIIAAVWIVGWNAFKFLKNFQSIETTDIILSGLSVAACFSPVYFNMLLDKIKEIKWGKDE